jgi:hypothetical protein
MSWVSERDALIAETLAFVEQVAGKKQETDARSKIVPIDAIQQVPVLVAAPRSDRPSGWNLTLGARV